MFNNDHAAKRLSATYVPDLLVSSFEPKIKNEERNVLIFMHGAGGNRRSHMYLLNIQNLIPDNMHVFLPQGPFQGGVGVCFWYLQIRDDEVHFDMLLKSAESLKNFIDGIPESYGFQPKRIILAGFSQGGTMSITFPFLYPNTVDTSFDVAGYIADHEGVKITKENAGNTKFVWCHGVRDFCNDYYLAKWGVPKIQKATNNLHFRPYLDMGHEITVEVLRDLYHTLRNDFVNIPNLEV